MVNTKLQQMSRLELENYALQQQQHISELEAELEISRIDAKAIGQGAVSQYRDEIRRLIKGKQALAQELEEFRRALLFELIQTREEAEVAERRFMAVTQVLREAYDASIEGVRWTVHTTAEVQHAISRTNLQEQIKDANIIIKEIIETAPNIKNAQTPFITTYITHNLEKKVHFHNMMLEAINAVHYQGHPGLLADAALMAIEKGHDQIVIAEIIYKLHRALGEAAPAKVDTICEALKVSQEYRSSGLDQQSFCQSRGIHRNTLTKYLGIQSEIEELSWRRQQGE